MSQSEEIELNDIKQLVLDCIKNDKIDFLATLLYSFQKNYTELASLATEGNYHSGWSHQRVLDFITFEIN